MSSALKKLLIISVLTMNFAFTVNFSQKGDSAFSKYNNELALNYYLKDYQSNKSDFELLVKIARAYIDLGEEAQNKKDKSALEYFKKAKDISQKMIDLKPKNYEGYMYMAMAKGSLALFMGGRDKVRLSREVKQMLDKALIYNKNSDTLNAITGAYHREIATLNWFLKNFAAKIFGGIPAGTLNESKIFLEKAVKINPEMSYGLLELGKTYWELEEKDLAKKMWQKVISTKKNDHNDYKYKSDAQELLKKHF